MLVIVCRDKNEKFFGLLTKHELQEFSRWWRPLILPSNVRNNLATREVLRGFQVVVIVVGAVPILSHAK